MKLHYYPETDSLNIELGSEPSAEVPKIADGLNIDPDEAGEIVGFDIDHASRRLDLTTLKSFSLPFKPTCTAHPIALPLVEEGGGPRRAAG